jgi:hypothetical protein
MTTTTYRPILCLDFDGTIHEYTSPWTDAITISDHVVPGFFTWAAEAEKYFRLVIYSSRSKEPGAIDAMKRWLAAEFDREWGCEGVPISEMPSFEFAHEKPKAFLIVDDRAAPCFKGDWSDPALAPKTLREFRPWNKP